MSLLNLIAQENNFKLHSAEIGFGGFHVKNNFAENGGIVLTLDLTTSFGKNLLSTSILTGSEIAILGPANFSFNEFKI